jgi:hypothetical protein
LDKKQISKKDAEIVAEMMQKQGFTVPGLEMPSLNNDSELPPLPPNKYQCLLMEYETFAMATVLKEYNTSPTQQEEKKMKQILPRSKLCLPPHRNQSSQMCLKKHKR